VSLFSRAKGKSFVGVSGESEASSGTGLVGVESAATGGGDVGEEACVSILGGSGLTIDVDAWNLGAWASWESGVGDVGLDALGLGEVGLKEVKLKKDMVMLLLSVGLLFFVCVGLTASPAFGWLIFFFSSSSFASSSKVVSEFDDTDLLMERGVSIPLIDSFLLLSSWLTLSNEVFLLLPSFT